MTKQWQLADWTTGRFPTLVFLLFRILTAVSFGQYVVSRSKTVITVYLSQMIPLNFDF